MYKPITFLLKYIFKTAGKVEVQGREKLPEEKVDPMLLHVHIQVLWMY